MGLRSSMILCAGGVLSNLVLVPLIWMIGSHLPDAPSIPATIPIAQMTAVQIFRGYVRFVGVGRHRHGRHLRHFEIAADRGRHRLRSRCAPSGSGEGAGLRAHRPRHFRDVDPDRRRRERPRRRHACWAALPASPAVILVGLALTLVFSFFFTSVAANAIATTARNPVSGMTMLTIIISSRRAAALRPLRHHGHVLRDGHRGHGVHGALGLRPGHHGFQDRLLARLDARRAGESEVPRRDRRLGRRRA